MNNERIEIPIEESEEFEIERYLFISNGYLQLLKQFTTDTEFNIDNERYDSLLNEYMESFIKYSILFDKIKNKYITENNIDILKYNNSLINFEKSVIIFYKENK